MGSKIRAKALVREHGVPVAPDNTVESLDEIGFPALVKASAGGGGRGMRIVRSHDQLADAIASAEREALSSFGDSTVFVERYVEGARHVEVQVFADMHGNVVALAGLMRPAIGVPYSVSVGTAREGASKISVTGQGGTSGYVAAKGAMKTAARNGRGIMGECSVN